jgi:hypothetical protein
MPNAVELSVRRGVGGCMWHNSVSVTLSGAPLWALWKHAPTSDSAAEATTFLMMEATLRMEPFIVSCYRGLSPQKDRPPRRLRAFETERYEASLWMCNIISEARYLMVASGSPNNLTIDLLRPVFSQSPLFAPLQCHLAALRRWGPPLLHSTRRIL